MPVTIQGHSTDYSHSNAPLISVGTSHYNALLLSCSADYNVTETFTETFIAMLSLSFKVYFSFTKTLVSY